MKKVLNIFLEHGILIVSAITVFLCDITLFTIAHFEETFVALLCSVVGLFFFCINILSCVYVVLFFRKENFLTPLLHFGLICAGKAEISVIGVLYLFWCEETNICLITLIICLLIRLIAFILIRIFKEKLKVWTGDEKVTSDAVFWARVLFKKLMKSIDPNCKF